MNRRQFFRSASAALAGAVLDPERLLWIPGAKTIFIPPAIVSAPGMLTFAALYRAYYMEVIQPLQIMLVSRKLYDNYFSELRLIEESA